MQQLVSNITKMLTRTWSPPSSGQLPHAQASVNQSLAIPMDEQQVSTLPIKFLTWNVMDLTTIKEELTQNNQRKFARCTSLD